jgi:imidazole glycerol-phosphate synthase subunit HisH
MIAKVAIVDSGVGNFGSIANALARVGGNPHIATTVADFVGATHIVLPGVGSFDSAIEALESRGLRAVLSRRALDEAIPVLGICLGMQLLGVSSEEGKMAGLGWLRGRTVRFRPPAAQCDIRVPHIGWNGIVACRSSPLLDGLASGASFYYVHSYHYVAETDEDTLATTEYGYSFAAVVQHRTIVGTQFHPERSGEDGLKLLRNFLRMRP